MNQNATFDQVFHGWIGLDWGDKSHAFALKDTDGGREEGTIDHSAESLHDWVGRLAARFGGRQVAVALEAKRGPVMAALRQYAWLTLYPINPLTSARYRTAFAPSGAKDDQPDARMLLDLACNHTDKLRPFEAQDQQTEELGLLVEFRRDTVNRRTAVLNQLTSLLKGYYPQVLALFEDINSRTVIDFLNRWPDLLSLKAARSATIQKFFLSHNLRRPELLEERLALIAKARALITAEHILRANVAELRCLLDQWRALHKSIEHFDQLIHDAFSGHPEAYLYRNLPGAGKNLAPRLCVAFGTVRSLYPDPESLQKLAGVAPVREKSGAHVWTHWRWQAPIFLRQTFVEWAGQTVVYSAWARAYYQRMLDKGKKRNTILRCLAFKWIRVLWKCWQTRTAYDEVRYMEQLARRKSPVAQPTKKLT